MNDYVKILVVLHCANVPTSRGSNFLKRS